MNINKDKLKYNNRFVKSEIYNTKVHEKICTDIINRFMICLAYERVITFRDFAMKYGLYIVDHPTYGDEALSILEMEFAAIKRSDLAIVANKARNSNKKFLKTKPQRM